LNSRPDDLPPPWIAALVAAVSLLGLAIRIHGIDAGLSPLESRTWWLAQMPWRFIARDSWYFPHLYELTHAMLPAGTVTEARLRLPSLLFGTASIPLIFLIGRRLFDPRVGLVAAFLLALSAPCAGYSQEARYYALLLFYALASLYSLCAALDDSRGTEAARRTAWVVYCAATALGIRTHLFGIFPWALGLAASIIVGIRRPAALKAGLLSAAATLLLSVGQWLRIARFASHHLTSDTTLWQTTYLRTARPGNIFLQLLEEWNSETALIIPGLALCALAVWLCRKTRPKQTALLAGWILLPLGSLFLLPSSHHFEPRYFAFIIPAYLVLAAAGIGAIAEIPSAARMRAALLLLLLLAAAAVQTRTLLGRRNAPYPGWREAIAHVNAGCSEGDAVVFYPPAQEEFLPRFYPLSRRCRQYSAAYLLSDRPYRIAELIRRHPRLWLISRGFPSRTDRDGWPAASGRLETYYSTGESVPFQELRVTEYRRRPGDRIPHDIPERLRFTAKRKIPPTSDYRLVANMIEILDSLPRTSSVESRILLPPSRAPRPVSVVRLAPGARFTGPAPADPALMFVWSGTVSLRGAAAPLTLAAGGLADAPSPQRPVRASADGAVLLLFPCCSSGGALPGRESLPPGGSLPEPHREVDQRSLLLVLRGPLILERPITGRRLAFQAGDIILSPPGRSGFRAHSNPASPATFLHVPL
jgi:hypothetical protein